MEEVRFNSPFISGNERKYIDEVFESGHFSGNGPFTKRVQSWLEEFLGAPRVLLTHSCTAGLEMSAMLKEFGPGDEIIIPSFTFVTTASSMMRTGAKVIFCEVEPETMLIDFDDVKSQQECSSHKEHIDEHGNNFNFKKNKNDKRVEAI